LDQQTLNILTNKSQADKAINSLKGILLGINLDGVVTKSELNELTLWAENYYDLIDRNPFKEFMAIIHMASQNEIPSVEAIEDLYWLCQKYEGDNYFYNGITADLQTLQGLCHGILADGIIEEDEVFQLLKWLKEHKHLETHWPYDELCSLILSIVADKKVDEEEKLVLKAHFNQFVNLNDKTIAGKVDLETKDINISALCTSEPIVDFENKTFCVTGVLSVMTRKELQSKILELGGISTNNVSSKTDYLIVGDNGNPAWAFACYGRKVEKAVNMRKEGHQIMLIHEFDLNDAIEDKG